MMVGVAEERFLFTFKKIIPSLFDKNNSINCWFV